MERRIQCFIQEYDTLLICYLLMNSFLKFNTTLNATLNSTNLVTLSILFCFRLQHHCNSSRMLNLNADLLWILYRKKSTYLYSCPEIVIADHEKFSFHPILEFMKQYTSIPTIIFRNRYSSLVHQQRGNDVIKKLRKTILPCFLCLLTH